MTLGSFVDRPTQIRHPVFSCANVSYDKWLLCEWEFAMHGSVLRCIVAFCSMLQYVAVCCRESHIVISWGDVQCKAACWGVLQCVVVCCSVLQYVAECCIMGLWAMQGSVLQWVAVCCGVLQCVAACCSVL